MSKINGKSNREAAFDYMRVIAAFGVVIIHVCAMQWKILDIYSSQWISIHVYDMAAKFCVPLFFMISGRFFLDPLREYSISKMIKKELHIGFVFIFWSLVYSLLNVFRVYMNGDEIKQNLNWIIIEFFTGEYHMWFLYAILGLYLITPILRKVTESQKMMQYYLMLFFVFELVWSLFSKFPKIGVLFASVGNSMVFRLTTGYSGYYVLGYYFYKYPLTGRRKKILYWLGAIGIIFTVSITLVVSWISRMPSEELAAYLSPNVAVAAAAIYHFILNKMQHKKAGKIISIISKYSFGCYLIHPFFLWIFEYIGFVPTFFMTFISVPIIAIIALVGSVFLTWIFSKIPYLKEVI